jgi:hypothetical protein
MRRPGEPDDRLAVITPDQVEQLPAGPLREGSFVVYCGNERRVSERFVMALRAMGVEADLFHEDVAPLNNNPHREDN